MYWMVPWSYDTKAGHLLYALNKTLHLTLTLSRMKYYNGTQTTVPTYITIYIAIWMKGEWFEHYYYEICQIESFFSISRAQT